MIPDFQANTLNWVPGRLVHGRSEALEYLEAPFDWGVDEASRYRTGSSPIRLETALGFEELKRRFEEAQASLDSALTSTSVAFLGQVVPARFGDRACWEHLSELAWHETFHVGQRELHRQLALLARGEKAEAGP